jgi:hypothetical protein
MRSPISVLRTAGQRWMEAAIIGFFCWYAIYVLILGKFFSSAMTPDSYRDLGILWDLTDYTAQKGHYPAVYFFPPSNAILVHLYGLIDRNFAFRVFLVVEVAAVGLTIWAWLRLIGFAAHPSRALVIVTAFSAAQTYIHIELHMHNINALTLAAVSLALSFEKSNGFSTGCYAFSVAMKPYGSVLILPWMAWRRNGRWVASALCWLALWFGALPVIWFGAAEAIQLYREWIVSLLAVVANDDPSQLSIQAGVATLTRWEISDSRVASTALILQASWIVAFAAFFLPSLKRRSSCCGIAAACEFAAILLIGLPLGNHQQPARGIVLLASTMVIASGAFDARRSPRLRAILGGILVAIGVSSHAVPMGPLHFLLTLPICMLALVGLSIVRATPADCPTTNRCI